MSRALLRSDGDDPARREAELRQFVTGLSNPAHQSFCIGPGLRRHADRYAFAVSLFALYSHEACGFGWTDTLEVVREDGEWRVDRPPRGGEGAPR